MNTEYLLDTLESLDQRVLSRFDAVGLFGLEEWPTVGERNIFVLFRIMNYMIDDSNST